MIFKYRFFEGQFLPIVPIVLRGKEGWMASRAYVDSGASYCLFHADVAEILGLVLENGHPHEVTVGDGNNLKVYLHKVKVSLAEKEFEAILGFSKGVGIGFNIVGRRDIFDKFIVIFNEKEKWVEFRPH